MSANFKENLKVIPSEQEEYKAEKIDAYRNFVFETIPGYIGFLEAINHTITELEAEGIIGKVKLRTRIKAINSALKNTEDKTLDDLFGFEIIAQNERDKEILMLLIHNLFVGKYVRQKNHNKSNGYFAHHCTGAVKNRLDGTEVLELEKHILEAQTNELKTEYRDMPKKEQMKFKRREIFRKVSRYPTLRQEILENGKIDEKLQANFEWALIFMDEYLGDTTLRKSMPIFEIQFKTTEVEQESKCGRAQHVKYKAVDEEEIRRKYLQRQLVRGVNFPFVFVRNEDGDLEIEHTTDTLINMWPFLKGTVEEYSQTHSCPVANYDMYFARIFPSLEPYVQRNLSKEPSIPIGDFSQENAWGILKSKIINGDFFLPDSNGMQRIGIRGK